MSMSTSIHPFHECECNVCQRQSDSEIMQYHRQINLLLSRLNEPQRRWYVAVLSQEPGAPSAVQLSHITGLDEKTIGRGRQELEADLLNVPLDRQRAVGGGRPTAEKKTRR
jgi:hypothetical protein